MSRIHIHYKNYFLRLALAVLLTVAVYSAVDYYTLANWDIQESLVVEILDIGPTKLIAPDEDSNGEPFQTVENDVVVLVLTGERKSNVFKITVTQMEGSGTDLQKGHRYILLSDVFEDGAIQYSIADAYRVSSVIGFIVFVCSALCAFAGRSGIRALAGLFLSVMVLLWIYVPFAASGMPPVPLAFAVVVFISAVTVFFVVHRKQARIVALLGSIGGISGAFLLGYTAVELWHLSGLAGESASLLFTTIPGIDIRGILLASIIISAVGAVLDVGISITAAMSELIEYDPKIALPQLWGAGIRVGSEVLGSMINTLILAYLGTSLPVAILISRAGANITGLLNDPYVAQEIVQSLAGTSGLLLTIPITATFFVFQEKLLVRRHLKKKKKEKTPAEEEEAR